MRAQAGLAWAVLACLGAPAVADMGSIPFEPGVKVFEPEQRALIAWNGSEEVMLLATQLRAARRTKVLEVMPLPSKPSVSEGEWRSLLLANNLLHWRQARAGAASGASPLAAEVPVPDRPAGRVVEEQRIGTHDIKVTEVLSTEGFASWALDYLKRQGALRPGIPEAFRNVIGEYLRDGFRWFVFDVVELGPKLARKDVLRFRFATDRLYFPLRITRAESGDTTVELMILTYHRIEPRQFAGWPKDRIFMPLLPVRLTGGEIGSIDPLVQRVMGRDKSALLRAWRIVGPLDGFGKDLLVRP